ncbi:MAG: putative coat protein [Alehxovirus pseudonemoriscola]|uniref:Coat protein n=1 Tax=Leviviridae sp. TaxID=2027243 RepID=A0ABY3SS35_9VIRU|nr:MAG: putative coat protein [Leviviridae sp.]
MLGTSQTITLGGSGGTAIVLPKINQDGYSSEYYLDDDSGYTYRCKIRNTRDNVKAGSQAFDRHTVTFTMHVKPTPSIPSGSTCETTFTIRNDPTQSPSMVADLAKGLAYFMASGSIAAGLFGWES